MLQSYATVLYAYVCYSLIRIRSTYYYSSSIVVVCYSLIRIRATLLILYLYFCTFFSYVTAIILLMCETPSTHTFYFTHSKRILYSYVRYCGTSRGMHAAHILYWYAPTMECTLRIGTSRGAAVKKKEPSTKNSRCAYTLLVCSYHAGILGMLLLCREFFFKKKEKIKGRRDWALVCSYYALLCG